MHRELETSTLTIIINMADITKCTGEGCELKETCYRFKANTNEFRQAYFTNPPNTEVDKCVYFWEINNN